MKLVIAEKPSVAQSLSAVIGATARKDGYLEGNGWRVSWCVGHLAGLADADSYDPKYAKWRYDEICQGYRSVSAGFPDVQSAPGTDEVDRL